MQPARQVRKVPEAQEVSRGVASRRPERVSSKARVRYQHTQAKGGILPRQEAIHSVTPCRTSATMMLYLHGKEKTCHVGKPRYREKLELLRR